MDLDHMSGPDTAVAQELRLRTEIPGPRSRELMARSRAAVATGVGVLLPVYVRAAAGGVVVDVDGNSLIDFGSGIAVTGVGNSAEQVVAEVSEQVRRFTHTCYMVTPYEPYVAVCEQLNARTPGSHDKRSVLFNSGAEAIENAVKIARSFTKRTAIVAFDHAYHGRTNLTMALTAKSMPYKHGFGPFAPDVFRAPASYPFRDGADVSGEDALARAVAAIESQVAPGDVAAVVIEPIQGEGGFVVPAPGFLPALAAWCTANGIVFVADEIQTGFARTGRMFALDHEGVVPDLIATAKGIAGGLPLSAVTGRAEIMDAVHVGGLGGTYGGNPIACAAALGTMRTIDEQDLVTRAATIEMTVLTRLREMQTRYGAIGDVRGRGAMLAIEVVHTGTREPDSATTKAIAAACHSAGLVLLTCGTDGNVIRLLPPLVMPEHLLEQGLDIIDQAFDEVTRNPTSGDV